MIVVVIVTATCGSLGWKAYGRGETSIGLVLAIFTLLLAAMTPFAIVTLFKPTSLVLTQEGFYMTGVGRIPLIPWSAVEAFIPLTRRYNAGHGVSGQVKGIGFRLKPGMSVDMGWKRRVYARGVDGEIALNLTTTVDETYRLLEQWRTERS